ncbi:unnamed protein product [Durusdinium trenchii]|uniref:Uncharacterized protein n=1 Tax=Durusdinium trenchii TaxID=1381693 RepID=A0ABP0N8E9_9DINO
MADQDDTLPLENGMDGLGEVARADEYQLVQEEDDWSEEELDKYCKFKDYLATLAKQLNDEPHDEEPGYKDGSEAEAVPLEAGGGDPACDQTYEVPSSERLSPVGVDVELDSDEEINKPLKPKGTHKDREPRRAASHVSMGPEPLMEVNTAKTLAARMSRFMETWIRQFPNKRLPPNPFREEIEANKEMEGDGVYTGVFEPGQDELPESAPTAEEETQRDGVPEEGAILGFLKQKLSECSRESAERTKIWTDVAKGPRGGPTSSRAPTSFHMKGIMLTTPNKPTFLNVPEMTPDPVDPVAKKGLLREKREEVAAKGRSKGANKGERAKKTKAQVKTVKSKPQKRQPNNGPMEAAFRKFVEKQKKVGVHYWKALKMWKVSPERGTIIASMSPSEQKRRRFA